MLLSTVALKVKVKVKYATFYFISIIIVTILFIQKPYYNVKLHRHLTCSFLFKLQKIFVYKNMKTDLKVKGEGQLLLN